MAGDVKTALLLSVGKPCHGVDGRLLVLAGRPLIVRAVDFLRHRFAQVVTAMPQRPALDLGDAAAAVRAIGDVRMEASALGALAAGLRTLGKPLFVMAAETAFPQQQALDRLLDAWSGADDACLPVVGERPLPLFGLYHPRCLPALERALAAGETDVAAALAGLRVTTVPFPDAAAFAVVAGMDDHARAQRQVLPDRPPFPGPAAGGGQPALVAIVGKSDAGKTTVVERLLPELQRLGLRVGTVKHDAHDFQIDHPGTDSYRHGAAGAPAYTVASPHRLAFVTLLDEELPLVEIVRRFYPGFDVALAEGYKRQAPYRIEVYRKAAGHPEPLCARESMLAVLSDVDVPHPRRFALDDAAGLAAFIVVRLESLRRY